MGYWSERNTSVFHMLGVTGSGLRFRKPEKLSEGKIEMFRLTGSIKFPRCWVIVSPGCFEKYTVSSVTREVTEDPYVNWCPPCLSVFVLFPVVIAYVSVHSSLVIEMQVYFVSLGLKNTGWAP